MGKILAGVWGVFYFFIFLMTFFWGPHPAAVGPLLWAAIYIFGCFAGLAVIDLISRRPAIGALVVLSGFLLWLVVEKYRPDGWYMVPALLSPGLLVLLPGAIATVHHLRHPPDVIRTDPKPPICETHDLENRGHTR
jgi:hypothetical protein